MLNLNKQLLITKIWQDNMHKLNKTDNVLVLFFLYILKSWVLTTIILGVNIIVIIQLIRTYKINKNGGVVYVLY